RDSDCRRIVTTGTIIIILTLSPIDKVILNEKGPAMKPASLSAGVLVVLNLLALFPAQSRAQDGKADQPAVHKVEVVSDGTRAEQWFLRPSSDKDWQPAAPIQVTLDTGATVRGVIVKQDKESIVLHNGSRALTLPRKVLLTEPANAV